MRTATRPGLNAPRASIAIPIRVDIVPAAPELDCSTARELVLRVGESIRTTRCARIEIDLEHVQFIDAAGLRSLIECRRMARRAGRDLVYTNPSHAVRRLVELFPELSPLLSEGE